MSLNDKIGGYPVEWFVQTPSEHFTCGICFDVFKNPHQCKNGHTFCYSCVSKALESHSKCPTCKIALNFKSLGVNLQLRNLIDLLVVKCSHDDGGCEWTGSLECSLRHFRTCSMRCIPCPLHAHHVCTDKKCSGRIKRKDVHNHLSGGPKRNVNDSMLIMAETIAYQKKEIELLHEFIVSGKVETHALGLSIFVGSFDEDGKKEGFGFIKHPDGTTYSGHFHKGQYVGFGVLRSNQCVKAGEWENGKLNGHCLVRRPHTEGETLQNCSAIDTYVGEWHNNRMHGFGRRIFAGVTYVGPFENSMKQGEFSRVCANDNIVECTYENSVMSTTTTSTLTLPNGQRYVGTVDESFHFKEGKFSSADGTVYEGIFGTNANQFRVNGTGTITYTDGSIYTGEFRSGLKHGKGSLFDSNGVLSAAGKWNNDKIPVAVRIKYANINRSADGMYWNDSGSNLVENEVVAHAVTNSLGEKNAAAVVGKKRSISQL